MYRLSISNIGWESADDENVYLLMKKYGFLGLEIAPTKIIPERPYDRIDEAVKFAIFLKEKYGFVIPSMQSIWYGRSEKLFGSSEEYAVLYDYTKKAIDLAASIGCKNLVFGCPKNRSLPEKTSDDKAVVFFKELGDFAASKGTAIGIEANPPIYNTNYINTTVSALELIDRVDSKGFRLNLDLGTMIHNDESTDILIGKVDHINHIHISEPYLKPIEKRKMHSDLKKLLVKENYDGFISIEMGLQSDLTIIEDSIKYVREIFQ